eukprot:c17780_g1_i1.p1 GENE.c17780_g1_i1~~c17780_g1_i1.p1  ORF type:complete len:538 (+),score=135.88 c17780_g1_i1:167-1780(+)
MNVTTFNFEEALEIIKTSLASADFVAFDAEFSGVESKTTIYQQQHAEQQQEAEPELQMSSHGKDQITFARHRQTVSQFMILQFGMCIFSWDSETNKYIARPFNFFIFPDDVVDKAFTCSSATFRLLAANKFDFNKLIRTGIPYISHHDAEMIRNKPFEAPVIDTSSIDDRSFLFKELDRVMEWMSDLPPYRSFIEIPLPNRFQCLVVVQEILSRFDEIVAEISLADFSNRKFTVRVTKLKADDKKAYLTEIIKSQKEKREAKLSEQVGFRACIDAIRDAKVGIVSHNSYVKVLHAYDKFFRPLPRELAQFKHEWSSLFNTTIDTKYVIESSLSQFKDLPNSSLSTVYDYFCRGPDAVKIEFAPGFEQYNETGHEHEPAFDAFVTGSVLASVTRHLASLSATDSATTQQSIDANNNSSSGNQRPTIQSLDKSLVNKLFLKGARMDLAETPDDIFPFAPPTSSDHVGHAAAHNFPRMPSAASILSVANSRGERTFPNTNLTSTRSMHTSTLNLASPSILLSLCRLVDARTIRTVKAIIR